MKIIAIVSLIISSISDTSFALDSDTTNGKYKVNDVIELEDYYLILAIKEDNLFRILSKKQHDSSGCESVIKLGEYYDFNLRKIEMLNFGKLEECKSYFGRLLAFVYFVDGHYVTLPSNHDSYIYYGLNIAGRCLR